MIFQFAAAAPKDSTNDSVELLPTLHIATSNKTITYLYHPIPDRFDKRSDGFSSRYYYYHFHRDLLTLAGTRNLNYYINFSAKSSSIGFEDPHFRGARADGNAVFIDGVRMFTGSLVESSMIGLK